MSKTNQINNKNDTNFFKKTNPLNLSFKDLSYSVKLKNNVNKELLHSISGNCKPGMVTALMGPSGAGKTTLLNVLSWRAGKNISGDILINYQPRKKIHKKILGYVMQKDIFFPTLTVEQTLMFTTKLRRGDLTSKQQRNLVYETMESLQLLHVRNVVIGDAFTKGISGGELKRLNVANEFISNPAILFLDEPTTGLDSSSAVAILTVANSLAQKYKINVILSIHQPSSQAFSMLNRVILISDGYIVFQGPASELLSYFAFIGFPTPRGWNISDYVMDLLYDEVAKLEIQKQATSYLGIDSDGNYYMTHRERDLRSVSLQPIQYEPEEEFTEISPVATSSEGSQKAIQQSGESFELDDLSPQATDSDKNENFVFKRPPYLKLVWTLILRGIVRDTKGTTVAIDLAQCILLSLLVGVLWFQSLREVTQEKFNDRVGFLFFNTTFWMFNLGFSTLASFPNEKFVIAKERSAKFFPISAYVFAKTFTDVLYLYVYPTMWTIIVLSMAGVDGTARQIFGLWLSFLLIAATSHSIGLAVSSMVEGMLPGSVVLAVYLLFSMLAAGFYIEYDNMPIFLRWGRWISIVNYAFSLVTYIHMEPLTFTCDDYPGCVIPGSELRLPFATGFPWFVDLLFILLLWCIGKVVTYYFLRYSKRIKMN